MEKHLCQVAIVGCWVLNFVSFSPIEPNKDPLIRSVSKKKTHTAALTHLPVDTTRLTLLFTSAGEARSTWSQRPATPSPHPPPRDWTVIGVCLRFPTTPSTSTPPDSLSLVPWGRVKSAISVSWLARHLCLLLQLSGLPNERESGDQGGTANTDTRAGRLFVLDRTTGAQGDGK